MTAFIPFTPDFSSLAQEAGRRLLAYCGISGVAYLPCRNKRDCHKLKLEAWLDYDGPVVMGDADLFVMRSVPLPVPSGGFVYAAPNDAGTGVYAGTVVPQKSALCSCLVGMDMGHPRVRKAVQSAIKLQARDYQRDEYYLNVALFSQPELCVARLSNHWNWCGPPVPETIALHAAGREDKEAWLKQYCGVNTG